MDSLLLIVEKQKLKDANSKSITLLSITVFIFINIPLNLAAMTDFLIMGKITDAKTGNPLTNANVIIEGTSIGTTSNEQGEFRIDDVPPGNYILKVTYIGYKPATKSVRLIHEKIVDIEIELEPTILETQRILVTAEADVNRAITRETPIAFTTVSHEELGMKYTTSDLPELISDVPGVWTSSAGLGETEIWIRGFSSDKIQFMLNGIQMNEPEDNTVYWSNWTGLSGVANSVQVQRGPGYLFSGSGAFGGSVHIETMGVMPQKGTTARISYGFYTMQGIESGPITGKVADGTGAFDYIYKPVNYMYSVSHNSGPIWGGKLYVSFLLERKAGDSYIQGTNYDGYAFGLEAQSMLGNHRLSLSFVGSPQQHNQAFAFQDIDLLKTLGREYNRKNHEWQQNYYFKPLWHLKHEWSITKKQALVSSVFFSFGKGADQTIVNPLFNVETGEVGFQPVSKANDCLALGKHALYLLQNFNIWMTGLQPGQPGLLFWGYPLEDESGGIGPENLFTEQHDHSWQERKRRDHSHFGIATHFQNNEIDWIQFAVGSEGKYWKGHRTCEAWKLRMSNWYTDGQPTFFEKLQYLYDYNTGVFSSSAFGRITLKPLALLTVQTGSQFYFTTMKVKENPINIFDLGNGQYTNIYYRTSADQQDTSGNKKFTDNDYKGTFSYLVPWIGCNFNLTNYINLFINYATAKKEPGILDWYDPATGPKLQKKDKQGLKPESVSSFEIGTGYIAQLLELKLNYYYTRFKDKIESVIDINERYTTMNAGQALFQGIECELKGHFGRFNCAGSAMFSKNRWERMNVSKIFDADANEVIGKVVPFSPERVVSASLDYRLKDYRIGFRINWWDRYYATYTHKYTKVDGTISEARLPYFFDLSAKFCYITQIENVGITFRLDLNNITNRANNFMRAQYTIDYTRNDNLAGKYNWYVLQAPLFNAFFTIEFAFP